MRYCKKCKSMMTASDGRMKCVRCGALEDIEAATTITMETGDKEIVIVDSATEAAAMSTTSMLCSKCGNKTAYWRLEQTRAADEPTTRIYTCTKCKYVWREY